MGETSNLAWLGFTHKGGNQMETLVVEHDIKERAMHMQDAIPARTAFVINEPQLAESIHKETDA